MKCVDQHIDNQYFIIYTFVLVFMYLCFEPNNTLQSIVNL